MELYQALITLDGWTFLAQICNLMIQLFIFKKFLLNPVKNVIAERKAKADSQIADATKLRTEAEAMKAEYEQNLQNARTEANEIVANAQKTATARGEEIVGEARAQAAALKQKAEADIAQERKKAVNEVKDEIGGIAMEIASKVVEREISEKDHKDLIDEFIKNVGEASGPRLQGCTAEACTIWRRRKGWRPAFWVSWTKPWRFLRQTRTTCICSAPPAFPKRSAAACWMKHCGIRSTSMC